MGCMKAAGRGQRGNAIAALSVLIGLLALALVGMLRSGSSLPPWLEIGLTAVIAFLALVAVLLLGLARTRYRYYGALLEGRRASSPQRESEDASGK